LSPSEEIAATRTLIVDTKVPATEITVIDSAGNALTTAVRRLELSLPAALYKIRYRIGNRVVDDLIELPPGQGAYEVTVPPLPILSAAPLPSSDTSGEAASARFAQELLKHGHSGGTAKRASLFIFISSVLESANDPSDLPARPGAGISIHTFSGEKIGDLENAEVRSGCCGWALPVDPGNYILRAEMPPGRPVEQTLVAVEGWQVQFYARIVKSEARAAEGSGSSASHESSSPPEFVWQLDMGRSGVLLIKEPALDLPAAEQMKWTAAARQALAAGRQKAAPDQEMLKALLREKFQNPMLGIYAGHLFAMQKEPNLDLLREVVDNLIGMVGDHPDVTPLLITLKDKRAASLLYREPPMLRRSWSMIVEASTPEKDLRPARSYAARIGACLWGSGAWLAWRMPPADDLGVEAFKDWLPILYAQASSGKLSEGIRHLMDSSDEPKLSPAEELLARCLDLASNQIRTAHKFTLQEDRRRWLSAFYPFLRSVVDSELLRDTKKAFTAANLMKITGLPYSTITEAAASLATKLGVTASQSILSQFFGSMKMK
jgi:hypothetical protein